MNRYVLLGVVAVLALAGLFLFSGYSERSYLPTLAYPVGSYIIDYNASLSGTKVLTFLDDDNYLDLVIYSVDKPNGRISWCYFTYAGDSNCHTITLPRPNSNYSYYHVTVLPAGRYIYVGHTVRYVRSSGSRIYRYRTIYHTIWDVRTGRRLYLSSKSYEGYEHDGRSSHYEYDYDPQPFIEAKFSGTPGVYYVLFKDFVDYYYTYSSNSGWYEDEQRFYRLFEYFRGAHRISPLKEWQTLDSTSYPYSHGCWRKYEDAFVLTPSSYRVYYRYSPGCNGYKQVGFYSNGTDYGVKVTLPTDVHLRCAHPDFVYATSGTTKYLIRWNSSTYEPLDSNVLCHPLYEGYTPYTIGKSGHFYFVDENGLPVSNPFNLPTRNSVYAFNSFHVYQINDSNVVITVYRAPPVIYGFEANVLGVLSYDENIDTVPVHLTLSPVIVDANAPYTLSVLLDGNEVYSFDSNYPSELNIPVSTPGDHTIVVQAYDQNTVYSYGEVTVHVLAKPWDVTIWYVVPEVNRAVIAATATDDDTNTLSLRYDWKVTAYYLTSPPNTVEFNDTMTVDINASDPSSPFYGAETVRACVTVTDPTGLSTTRCANIDLKSPTENIPEVVYGPPIEKHVEKIKTRYFPVVRPVFESAGIRVSAPKLGTLSALPVPVALGGGLIVVAFLFYFLLH